MNKLILCIYLIIIVGCGNDKSVVNLKMEKPQSLNKSFYFINFKIKDKDSTYKDSLVKVKNYQPNDSNRIVMINDNFEDFECEKLLFDSKHINPLLPFVIKHNRFLIINYSLQQDSSIIARFYIADKSSLKIEDCLTFLIYNN